MDNPITKAFSPLIGLPCWSVTKVQGSILSFEFGEPRLVVREPIASEAAAPAVRVAMARRNVKPVGAWNLTVLGCHWQVASSGVFLANDDAHDDTIMAALRQVDGQKLTGVALDPVERATTFHFDLGATLKTSPYAHDQDDQWLLYMPGENVLTYRADGCYSLGRSDLAPGQEIWQTVRMS